MSAAEENNTNTHDWRFCQVFGEAIPIEEVQTPDMITAIEYDTTGELLAAGDRGGRVVVFERVPAHLTTRARSGRVSRTPNVEYRFHHEFQAHDLEFDALRSIDVEERVNVIRWLPSGSPGMKHLLTTNDKTIKLWRLWKRRTMRLENLNLPATYLRSRESIYRYDPASTSVLLAPLIRDPAAAHAAGVPALPAVASLDQLRIPHVSGAEDVMAAVPRRQYANGHNFHIHSLSCSADGRTFLSADDLTVHMWDLESNTEAFNVSSIRPQNMEMLSEIITSATFHPSNPSLYAFGTSKGTVHLCDTRARALLDRGTTVVGSPGLPRGLELGSMQAYSEHTQSAGAITFSHDGQKMAVRDFMSVRIYDLRAPTLPTAVIPLHNQVARSLRSLYDNDCMFDRYSVRWGHDDSYVVTGSFGNRFVVASADGSYAAAAEASRTVQRRRKRTRGEENAPFTLSGINGRPLVLDGTPTADAWADPLDCQRRVQYLDVHPKEPIIAAATLANLHLYSYK